MNIALYYYSGAGNTKFITQHLRTKLIANNHTVKLLKITKRSIETPIQNVDLYIIGFPVYDFSAPKLVSNLIQNLKPDLKPIAFLSTKAFLSADAIQELSELAKPLGFTTVATLDLVMPGTDALAFAATKGSRTERVIKYFHSRKIGKKLNRFIARIEKNCEIKISKKWYSYLAVLIPKRTKKAVHNQYSKYIPEFHVLSEICTSCMLCVNNCPQENIRFEENIKFGENCDMCLKCLHNCPVEAIQIGTMTEGKARYNKVGIKI